MSDHMTVVEALEEVGLTSESCPCGCGPRETLHERGFAVANPPDEEALRSLDTIERLIQKGERNDRLLDGRDYRHRPYQEAYRLLGLLREKAERGN